MILSTSDDEYQLYLSEVYARGDKVYCNWIIIYIHGKNKRKITNSINTELRLEQEKIVNIKDSFSIWNWLSQVYGLVGLLLGGLSFYQNNAKKKAIVELQYFIVNQKNDFVEYSRAITGEDKL